MSVTTNFARESQGVTNRKLDITCITLTWKILLYLFHLFIFIILYHRVEEVAKIEHQVPIAQMNAAGQK